MNSPYQMGGLRTAASILQPSVVDFLDLSHPNSRTEIDLEEIRVETACGIVGARVGDIEDQYSQLRIIGLKRNDESFELAPDADNRIRAKDHLVVIGERESLVTLARDAVATSPP